MQLPFLRVLIQGRIGVAIFCFVAGYVCALKPIKLCQQGNHRQAYESIAKSAIRRVPRLALPVTVIITLSCLAAQLGAFETAKHCDGYGLPETSPDRRSNVFSAINALFHDFVRVWTQQSSEYGAELWTMMPILTGAYYVYIFLVATAHVRQEWRMIIAIVLAMLRWASNDAFFGMQFFFGAFMADLQNLDSGTFSSLQTQLSGALRGAISITFLVVGLFVASLPEDHFEWQPWSLALRDSLATILPKEPDFPRFSSGLGLDIIVLGLHFSPMSRNVLSNRFFRWLGSMSFAVYLLHNQILRSVLCWMVYGFTIPAENEPLLAVTSPAKFFIVIPVYIGLTYGSAYLWTTRVDSWCARVSEQLVNAVTEDTEEKTGSRILP